MKNHSAMIAGAAAVAALAPCIANASYVLDTGTPTGSGAPIELTTAQFIAGEFAATAGDTIVDLSAYLTQGAGEPGDTFTFDVYANSGFTSRPSNRPAPVYTATGTFTANGWNTTAVNWTPTTTGNYWLALQVASTTDTHGLDAPLEASSSTGTAPALAFAYSGTGTNGYTVSSAYPIGLEVSQAAPVPLPASAWLLGSALLAGVRSMRRRRVEASAGG